MARPLSTLHCHHCHHHQTLYSSKKTLCLLAKETCCVCFDFLDPLDYNAHNKSSSSSTSSWVICAWCGEAIHQSCYSSDLCSTGHCDILCIGSPSKSVTKVIDERKFHAKRLFYDALGVEKWIGTHQISGAVVQVKEVLVRTSDGIELLSNRSITLRRVWWHYKGLFRQRVTYEVYHYYEHDQELINGLLSMVIAETGEWVVTGVRTLNELFQSFKLKLQSACWNILDNDNFVVGCPCKPVVLFTAESFIKGRHQDRSPIATSASNVHTQQTSMTENDPVVAMDQAVNVTIDDISKDLFTPNVSGHKTVYSRPNIGSLSSSCSYLSTSGKKKSLLAELNTGNCSSESAWWNNIVLGGDKQSRHQRHVRPKKEHKVKESKEEARRSSNSKKRTSPSIKQIAASRTGPSSSSCSRCLSFNSATYNKLKLRERLEKLGRFAKTEHKSSSAKVHTPLPKPVWNVNWTPDFIASCLRQRRKQQLGMEPLLEVRNSEIAGLGLFATRHISRHIPLLEYRGEMIDDKEADRREAYYNKTPLYSKNCYLFRLGPNMVIDGTLQANIARFINHSCDPNCVAWPCWVPGNLYPLDTSGIVTTSRRAIVIFTMKNIEPGQEITYDYNLSAGPDPKVKCWCGTGRCREWL